MEIATKSVQGRRHLRFANYDEMLADVHRLAAGPTRQLGNWSLGQICDHLAKAMHTAVDGAGFSPPWIVKFVGPLLKNRFLTKGMKPGFRLPKSGAALLPSQTDCSAGIAQLEQAVQRLRNEAKRERHGIFGRLSREEWDQLMLRHAEMHLGFILPQAASVPA